MRLCQDEIGLEIISKKINSVFLCVVLRKEDVGISFNDSIGCLNVSISFIDDGKNVIFESVSDYLNSILENEINKRRFLDPTKILPKEIWNHILSMMLTTDRKRCALVCKNWYGLWLEHRQKITFKQYKYERQREVKLFKLWYLSHRKSARSIPFTAWNGGRLKLLPIDPKFLKYRKQQEEDDDTDF